jgi:hypothetical protein
MNDALETSMSHIKYESSTVPGSKKVVEKKTTGPPENPHPSQKPPRI